MPKFRIATRSAWIRLGILAALLAVAGLWGWWTMIRMPLNSYRGPWVPLDAQELSLRAALKADVQMLAGTVGERNVARPREYAAAAEFIERSLTQAGYAVDRQTFIADGHACWNLEAARPGRERASGIVVVGAHYDSAEDCPGANDNGSAVAALLALARTFATIHPERTLRFVAFANEEPPFFQTEGMGSLVYARRCRANNDPIVAMISLETIGYYRDEKGSQQYPPPVGFFYPDTGNFIAIVGNTKSRRLVRQCVASFRRQVRFPSEGAALPAAIPGVGWSDHWAFWQVGYPAVMVTDTAPFRYPHYHTPHDTPDKLDYDRFTRVVTGMHLMVAELVGAVVAEWPVPDAAKVLPER